jgi:hypothetical protein
MSGYSQLERKTSRRTERIGMPKQHVLTGNDPAPRYMLLPGDPGRVHVANRAVEILSGSDALRAAGNKRYLSPSLLKAR